MLMASTGNKSIHNPSIYIANMPGKSKIFCSQVNFLLHIYIN